MAITVTCPNPACGQMASLEDKHAGTTVACPKCGGAIAVPAAAAPVAAPPGTPVQFSGANFMANVERLAGNAQAKLLLWVGLGCLGGLVIFTFFPWGGGGTVGTGDFAIRIASVSGIQFTEGVLQLLLSLGAVAFVIVAIVLNQQNLFNISTASAAGWAALDGLWRIINLAQGAAGIGIYLSILAALGAAGTLGFIAFQRLMKK